MKTLDIESLELKRGSHQPNESEMCVMEAVSFIAGEEWSDYPKCASPVIAAFLRSYNDSVNNEVRQSLKQYITRLIGTNGSYALEELRSLIAADWLVRTHTPAWLRLAGLNVHAEVLESLPEITSMKHITSIRGPIEAARESAAAARYAAWDTCWYPARDAAWAAAGDAAMDASMATSMDAARAAAGAAARDAARDAAWAAAGDTSMDAARAAAGAAARGAAWAAAGDAAWDALKPTVNALQATIPVLIERMLNATDLK